MKNKIPKATPPTEETKIVITAGDCDVVFELAEAGKFVSKPATIHKNPNSEFLFEYDGAIRLTDTLTHRQYEDIANNQRITEIYIVRKKATNPMGFDAIQIPLLKIIAS
jgi:hypothetical protein